MTALTFFEKVPILLIYFLPGYVFIMVRNSFIPSRKRSDLELILGSIFWSFVIINFSRICIKALGVFIVWNREIVNSNPTNLYYIVGLFIVAAILGITWAKAVKSTLLKLILLRFRIQLKPHTNVWNEVMDLPYGGWVRVYLKKNHYIYIGELIHYTIDPNQDIKELYIINYALYNSENELIGEGEVNSGVYLEKEDFYAVEVISFSA